MAVDEVLDFYTVLTSLLAGEKLKYDGLQTSAKDLNLSRISVRTDLRGVLTMVQKARIRLTSTDRTKLDGMCEELRSIAKKTGVKMTGPIPLPTKRLVVPTRKSPCGEGTHTWDHYELRIHKRLIEIDANERCMRRVMRIKVPDDVYIEITMM